MGELAKIDSFRKELALAETIEQIKLLGDAALAYQFIMQRQGANKNKIDEIGEFNIEVECKKAEWLDTFYPHGGTNQYNKEGTKTEPSLMPVTKKESARAKKIKKFKEEKPNEFDEIKSKIKEDKNTILNINSLAKEINKNERKDKEINENRPPDSLIASIKKADCLSIIDDVAPIDLLITDPPYFTDGDFTEHVSKYLNKVKNTGQAYVFIGSEPTEISAYINLNSGNLYLQQILIWNYNNTGQRQPNERYTSNYQICLYYRGNMAPLINKPADGKEQYACQTINAPDGRIGDRYHKWQKPIELIERLIRNSSNEGDFIFDPFAGSGTMILAGAKLGRIAKGCEIDETAINICIERGCISE
jgi:hypothetical protein